MPTLNAERGAALGIIVTLSALALTVAHRTSKDVTGSVSIATAGLTPAPGMSDRGRGESNPSASRAKPKNEPKIFWLEWAPYGTRLVKAQKAHGALMSGEEIRARFPMAAVTELGRCEDRGDSLECPCTREEDCSNSPVGADSKTTRQIGESDWKHDAAYGMTMERNREAIEEIGERAARETTADLCVGGKVPADIQRYECDTLTPIEINDAKIRREARALERSAPRHF